MSVNHLKLSSHSGFDADATVTDDGRVDIAIQETDPAKLAALLAAQAKHGAPSGGGPEVTDAAQQPPRTPRLNVVIQVVGSRGDVQPFVALGHVLRRNYGHRVRLVTHSVFRDFVTKEKDEDGGSLEFFDIGGGDPAELMAFMVQNGGKKGGEDKDGQDSDEGGGGGGGGGLIPPMEAYTNGEVASRRRFIEAILQGCWRSMVDGGGGGGGGGGGDNNDEEKPFVADCLIANPPSFAHVHIAERLAIPLHIMFTMPWTPTRAFPHPLANLQSVQASSSPKSPSEDTLYAFASYLSYTLVECLTWQGLGDVVNRFRTRALGLDPLSPLLAVAPFQAGGLLGRLRVPTTYCWSPALLPKPPDWGAAVTVAGYFFDAADSKATKDYTPSPELAAFLEAGPSPPIYVGFGSIVVDDPAALTRAVLGAVRQVAGVRAIVSQGWGGLGGDEDAKGEGDKSSDIFFLKGDCPHDWLFPRVACVVHHGGAGTTAAGLRHGCPTAVVPFFGDQPFWGALVAKAGAGPQPLPYPRLTADRLAEAIRIALQPATRDKARALGAAIRGEAPGGGGGKGDASKVGTAVGAAAFHQHLDLPRLRCEVLPDRAAAWEYRPKAPKADKKDKKDKDKTDKKDKKDEKEDKEDKKADKKEDKKEEKDEWEKPKQSGVRLSALAAAVLAEEGKLDMADLELFRAQEYNINTDDQPWEPISAASSAIMGDLSSIAMAVADFPLELFKKRKQQQQQQEKAEEGEKSKDKDNSSGAASEDGRPSLDEAVSMTMPPQAGQESGTDKAASNDNTEATKDAKEPAPQPPAVERVKFDTQAATVTLDTVVQASQSVGRIVTAGLQSPLHFCVGLARGFHNAPRLYHDDTVRSLPSRFDPDNPAVDGLGSGLKAASRAFGLGLYDGVTGLVTQPMRGAEQERDKSGGGGAKGLVKGFAKGLGGIVFKPAAGAWSVPAYALQGVQAEVDKLIGGGRKASAEADARRKEARRRQGERELKAGTTEAERREVVQRWEALGGRAST